MQYFEAAVREEQGGGLNPAARMKAAYAESDVSFFISVYSELEEPDGISGMIHAADTVA
jgi:serine/threonine-protein kinase ATR